VANNGTGINRLLRLFKKTPPALVLFEATGKYHRRLAQGLQDAGQPFVIANPRRVHRYADTLGQSAKSDPIDAVVCAAYAASREHTPTRLPDRETLELADLVVRHVQLTEFRTAERNRLQQAHAIAGSHERFLTSIAEAIERNDEEIRQRIAARPEWAEMSALYRSVPGVGAVTTAVLIAHLPELGTVDRRTIAALVGVAPIIADSGKTVGPARILGGRMIVRNALFMAATTAVRMEGTPFHTAFERLEASHKPYKVALTAIMRKMLLALNGIARSRQPYNAALLEPAAPAAPLKLAAQRVPKRKR